MPRLYVVLCQPHHTACKLYTQSNEALKTEMANASTPDSWISFSTSYGCRRRVNWAGVCGWPPPQAQPRWQRCVTETEKGFSPVLTHLLSQGAAHREVSRPASRVSPQMNHIYLFILFFQQAQEIIQDIFSAFKSKLQQLKLTNQTTRRILIDKVKQEPRLSSSSSLL